MDQKTIPQLPAQMDSAPPAAKKTKAEISRFYRFVNSVAESIDSSNFDSVSVIQRLVRKKNLHKQYPNLDSYPSNEQMLLPTTRDNSLNSSSFTSSSNLTSSTCSPMTLSMEAAGVMAGKRKRDADVSVQMNQITSMNSVLMQQMQQMQQLQQQQHETSHKQGEEMQQQIQQLQQQNHQSTETQMEQMEQMRQMKSVVASVSSQGVFVGVDRRTDDTNLEFSLDNMNDFDLAVDHTGL